RCLYNVEASCSLPFLLVVGLTVCGRGRWRSTGIIRITRWLFDRAYFHVVEEAANDSRRHAGQGQRLGNAFPYRNGRVDLRVGRQPFKFRTVAVLEYVHNVRTANPFRVVQRCVLVPTLFELAGALLGVGHEIFFEAVRDGAGGTGLHASRFEAHTDTVGAKRAFVRLVIDLADAGYIERAAFDTVPATDTVVGNEIDNTVGVLDNGAWGRTCLQAARILTVHAAVLADEPLEVAFFGLDLVELHDCPGLRGKVDGVIVNADILADLVAQVVPVHTGDLTRLTADTDRLVNELRHFGALAYRG